MKHKCKFKVGDVIVFNSEFENRVNIPRGVVSMKITSITESRYYYIFLTHCRASAVGGSTEQLLTDLESIARQKISPNSIWRALNT